MRVLSFAAPAALALSLSAPGGAQAQQFTPGVDPNLVMMLEQMISYVWQGCQMGNQQACYNAQGMQAEAQYLIGAGQYCMQTNDPNACGYYQMGVMQVQQGYGMMMQGGQMAQMPNYNPANPLGATHQDRMTAISNWGQQQTQTWQQNQQAMDQNHSAFIDFIRQ